MLALSTEYSVLGTGLLGVIPSLGVLGPLALLAALFPAVFGGLMFWLKRWSNLLGALCTMSTVYWLHRYFAGSRLHGSWWGTEAGLWAMMGLTALAFALVA